MIDNPLASKTRVAVAAALLMLPCTSLLGAQRPQYQNVDGIQFSSLPDTGSVARAMNAVDAAPYDLDRILQLGLAQAGIRQFREAISTFSRGLTLAPRNALLLRWRGHRYLTLRQFDLARADLTAGLAIDSTLYGLWYHLGVLEFVQGEFDAAARAFARSQAIAPDAGELAGSTDWLWMSLARANRRREADAMLAKRPDSLPIANAYSRRLQLYRGELKPEELLTIGATDGVQVATLSFGIGNWYLVRRDTTRARQWFERAVQQSDGWPAFGFMAAEAELARAPAR